MAFIGMLMPQSYEKEINELAGLAGEVMDAYTTALFLMEEPKRERLTMVACASPSEKLIHNASIPLGHGLVGWVAKHGRPASAALKKEVSNLLFYRGEEDVKSFAAAPIFDGERLIGVLAVDSKNPDIFTDKRVKLLARFASLVGAMIIRGKQQSKLGDEVSGVKAMADLAESMSGGVAPPDLVRFLRTRLQPIIPHDHLTLAMRNIKTGEFELLGAGQTEGGKNAEEPFSITHYRFGWVIHQARPIYLADINAPVIPGDGGRWRSFVGAPVIADGEVYGAVGLLSEKPQAFKRSDTSALSLVASVLASVITAPALKECVRSASLTDPVTKTLFYRTVLDRNKKLSPSGVLALVDLKGFRHVNRELTPKGGDSVLAQMADRLKKSFGESAQISRYSADTFILILPGLSMGQAQKVILEALEQMESIPFHYNGVDAHIIPVAGAASCPEDGDASDDLLIKAHEALRKAKTEPGKKVLFHADLDLVETKSKKAQ